jgi:hypothetical protein
MAGDALVTIALAGSLFFSISPSAARGRVALSLLLTMAPFAVVAPFLGPAIDGSRRGRRVMVVGSSLGRAGASLAMAVVVDGLLLFPAAFTHLVLSKAYSVAKSALVPAAVDRPDELVEANSKLAIGSVVVGFVAAVPGVAVLRLAGPEWVLRLAAVLFVATAIAGIRVIDAPRERAASAGPQDDPPASAVSTAAVAMALLRAVTGFLTFLVAFAFRRADAPSWHFGVVLAASMAGSLGGAAMAPRLRGRVPEERMLAGSLLLVTVAGLALSQSSGLVAAAAAALAVGLAASSGKLAFDALVQRDAPAGTTGRSFARFEAGFQLVWVVGALLPVLIPTPLGQGLGVLGIAGLLATITYSLTVRTLRKTT